MAFIEEIPSAEDIKNFDLPFWPDLEKPIEWRRTWLADRERDVYFLGVGVTGNQAFDDNIKKKAILYLGKKRFNIILEPGLGSLKFEDNPYIIDYPKLLQILVHIPERYITIDAMQEAQKAPDDPHPLLQNKSFNEFVSLLKEALAMWRAGYSNKRISGTITVTFGF